MSILIALVSLIPIILVGMILMRLLVPQPRTVDASVAERVALALQLGSGAVAVFLFYVSLLNSHWAITVTLAAVGALIIAGVFGFRRTKLVRWPLFRPSTDTRIETFLAVPLGFWLAILGAMSLLTDLGFDGLTTWAIKARAAFVAGGWDLSYFTDPTRQVTHQDYPLLIPTLEAWVYVFLGRVDEQAVKIIFIAFYAALLVVFYYALRREFSPLLSAAYTGLLGSTPYLASMAGISGYVDVPLLVFIFSAAIYIRRGIQQASLSDLLLGGILSALGVWVKREGIVFWALNLVALALYAAIQLRSSSYKDRWFRAGKSLLAFVAPAALILTPWFAFLALNHISNTDFIISLDVLRANLDRLPVIALTVVIQFVALGEWGWLWILFFAVSIIRWRNLRSGTRAYIWVSVVVPIAALAFTFVFSIWVPFTEHMTLSMDRLVLQVVPLAWYFIALQVPELDGWLQATITRLRLQASGD